jgi:hypothetical protein
MIIESEEVSPLKYTLGIQRLFGTCDIRTAGLGRNWATPEEGHVWNDGPNASFFVSSDMPKGRCLLGFEGEPYIRPGCSKQDITLYVNGLRLGFWRLTDTVSYQLLAPVEPEQWLARGKEGLLHIIWHLPDSIQPASLGDGEDRRELGFCFRSFTVRELDGRG